MMYLIVVKEKMERNDWFDDNSNINGIINICVELEDDIYIHYGVFDKDTSRNYR